MAEHNNPMRNASYKMDLTAYEAIKNLEQKDKDRYHKFLGCIFRVGELSDFYIEDLIVKDKRTGKIYSL